MRDKRLRLDHIFEVVYEEPLRRLTPQVVVRKRRKGDIFLGQQKLHVLGFSVLEDISSRDCLTILRGYGDFVLCPGGVLWTLVKQNLPAQRWCVVFDERGCVWKIDSKKREDPHDSAKLHYRIGSLMDGPLRTGDCLVGTYYSLREIDFADEVS